MGRRGWMTSSHKTCMVCTEVGKSEGHGVSDGCDSRGTSEQPPGLYCKTWPGRGEDWTWIGPWLLPTERGCRNLPGGLEGLRQPGSHKPQNWHTTAPSRQSLTAERRLRVDKLNRKQQQRQEKNKIWKEGQSQKVLANFTSLYMTRTNIHAGTFTNTHVYTRAHSRHIHAHFTYTHTPQKLEHRPEPSSFYKSRKGNFT